MDRAIYYVSVQAGTMLREQGAAAYEFVIEATPEEADRLGALFEEKEDADDGTYIRAHLPAYPQHIDGDSDEYDGALLRIYRTLYELGTPETRAQIREMRVLNAPEL